MAVIELGLRHTGRVAMLPCLFSSFGQASGLRLSSRAAAALLLVFPFIGLISPEQFRITPC